MELSEAIERCRVDDVFLCEGPRQPQKGSLGLIGHHLIFSPAPAEHPSISPVGGSSGGASSGANQEFWLLHRAVDRVLVEPTSRDSNNARQQQGAFLRLKCKNFMLLSFEINELADAQAVARSIEKLSNLHGVEHDYPFYYRCPFTVLDNGWEAYSLEQHTFARLQLHTKDKWRISAVNRDFEVCPAYPELVIVPKGIGDDYLRISATFRDGGRFPVLSYYHQPTRSCIVRCGQPLIGPTNRRCKEDEVILNSFLSKFSKGMIFDTRTKLSAQTSRGKGGGCESQMYYSQWKYVNGNIVRIVALREALARLIEACLDASSDKWLSRLANSGWLQYVADVLTAAATVAQVAHCMDEGTAGEVPVLVHGGEGTDSTLLVTSLAQLLLDPDARTIRGFQALVEQEWIGAGHPFSLRCAHSAFATGSVTGIHEAPVFLCFLDCVWQVMRQYPSCLEFNERFLVFLFEHAYASEFGSFLGNNEQEKKRLGVKDRSVSLWSYVNHPAVLPAFLNSLYTPHAQPLWPSVAPQSIILWERMYFRWQRSWTELDRCQQMVDEWRRQQKEARGRLMATHQQQRESAMSLSMCSTMTTSSSAPPPAPSSSSATLPSTSATLEMFPRPGVVAGGCGGRIAPPPFALEEGFSYGTKYDPPLRAPLARVVKMDRLNIRASGKDAVEAAEEAEDGFDMLLGDPHSRHALGGAIGEDQMHHQWSGAQWTKWRRARDAERTNNNNNNNSGAGAAAGALVNGARQWLARLSGGTPFQ